MPSPPCSFPYLSAEHCDIFPDLKSSPLRDIPHYPRDLRHHSKTSRGRAVCPMQWSGYGMFANNSSTDYVASAGPEHVLSHLMGFLRPHSTDEETGLERVRLAQSCIASAWQSADLIGTLLQWPPRPSSEIPCSILSTAPGRPEPPSTSAVPAQDTQPLGNGDHGPRWPPWGRISLWSSPVLVPLSLGILWRLSGSRPGNGVGRGFTYRSKKGTGT